MKRLNWIAILLAMLLTAVSSMANQAIEAPAAGETVVLVVLGAKGAEPDFAAMGGRVLRAWSDRRLVVIPREVLATLKQHERVQYVQRVWTGEESSAPVLTEQSLAAPSWVQSAAGPTPPAWTSTYAYDPSGNVQSVNKNADIFNYSYDAVNRLANAQFIRSGFPVQTQNYSYDPYGNLLGIGDQSLTVNTSTNRLTSTQGGALFFYDTGGRLTTDADGRQYQYDGLDMNTLIDIPAGVAVDGDRRMIYTADDERIAVASKTRMTYRVRDFGARVLREWTSTNGEMPEWERDYIYAGGSLVAGEVQIDQRQNGMRHYHADHLGSTRMVTNGAAELVSLHDYQPFGAEFTPTTTEFDNTGKAPRDPLKFTGHERDYLTGANEDGDALDYMHARFYAPKWGRFLSFDPGKDWDLRKPQSWNMYAYVRNNPVNATDPTGREIYVQSHAVIDETKYTKEQDHTSIRIEPVDQKRYANDADFKQFKNAQTGRSYMTLGAGMGLRANLVSNPNRELDVKLDIKTEVVKVDLKGQDENKVIAALRNADKNYGDNLPYRPFPTPAVTMQAFGHTVTVSGATYNSNSYTAGLLRAVGLTPPSITRNVPGYDRPVPRDEFK